MGTFFPAPFYAEEPNQTLFPKTHSNVIDGRNDPGVRPKSQSHRPDPILGPYRQNPCCYPLDPLKGIDPSRRRSLQPTHILQITNVERERFG